LGEEAVGLVEGRFVRVPRAVAEGPFAGNSGLLAAGLFVAGVEGQACLKLGEEAVGFIADWGMNGSGNLQQRAEGSRLQEGSVRRSRAAEGVPWIHFVHPRALMGRGQGRARRQGETCESAIGWVLRRFSALRPPR